MWIRAHRPPKLCRGVCGEFTPKQQYYYNRSSERFDKTEDGKYLIEAVKRMAPEIGRVDGVRFYESTRFIVSKGS